MSGGFFEFKQYYIDDIIKSMGKDLNLTLTTLIRWMRSIDYKIINEQNKLKVREDLFYEIKIEEDAYWLGSNKSKERSVTYQGIADAISEQWF